MFIRIKGVLNYLWRAVDQHGVALDISVQERQDGAAVKRFFRRLLQSLRYKPKCLITNGQRSYDVARRALLPNVKYRTSRYLHNRGENLHRPTRGRMQRFKSDGQAQRFLSVHAIIYDHFRPWRHRDDHRPHAISRAEHDRGEPGTIANRQDQHAGAG